MGEVGMGMAMSKEYEYRRGEPFLEKAVDILHNICKAEPALAWNYQGGRWGKARLRKLLFGLDCYDSILKTGDSLELVRYFFLTNGWGFPEVTGEGHYLYQKLFVRGRWKNPAPTEEEKEEAYQRRLKFLGPDYDPYKTADTPS
jgi:hypothetical protein